MRDSAYKHDFFVLESREYINRRTTFISLLMENAVLQNMSNTDKKICQRHPLVYPQQEIKHRSTSMGNIRVCRRRVVLKKTLSENCRALYIQD